MEWTKCKDRQPEASGEYLVANVRKIFGISYTTYMVLDYSARHKGWNMCDENEDNHRENELFPAAWTAIEEYIDEQSLASTILCPVCGQAIHDS